MEVGPDGHIAAALLNGRAVESWSLRDTQNLLVVHALGSVSGRNVVEMMGKEMDAARSEK